jgi:protein O-mannosyl-transferase
MAKKKNNPNPSQAATMATPASLLRNQPLPVIENTTRNQQIVLAIIALCSFVAYLPGFENGFVWDDMLYIVNNELIKKPTLENLIKIWSVPDGFVLGNYHPLTVMSNYVEYLIVGENAWLYHLNNLFLHIFNSYLVFKICEKIGNNFLIGAATAILFAVHPLHVESVVWAAERKDVLYTCFLLLSLRQYLHYSDDLAAKGQDLDLRNRNLWLSLLFFTLSCLAKAMAVVLPVVLLLTDYFVLNRYKNLKQAIIDLAIKEKATFFAVALATGLMSIYVQRQAGADATKVLSDAYTGTERFFIINYGMLQYWIKMLIPFGLLPFYPYPKKPNNELPTEFYSTFFVVLGLVAFLYFLSRRNKKIAWAALYFLIVISPVSQILPVGSAIAADRYFYVSSVGPLFMLGMLINYLYQHGSGLVRQGLPTAGAIVVAGLTFLSFTQARMWKNPLTLFPKVLEKYPGDPLMLSNMGWYYYKESETEKDQGISQQYNDLALFYFEETHKADYKTVDSHVALGQMYFKQEKYDKTIENFEAALKLKPEEMKNLHWMLATAYFYTQNDTKAEEETRVSLKLTPGNPFAINVLGLLKSRKGEYDQARKMFEECIKTNSKFQDPYVNISVIYNREGNHAKEIEVLEKAIKLESDRTTAFKNLGVAYKAIGQWEKAVEAWKKGAIKDPRDGSFDYNIAQEYGQNGNNAEGIKYMIQAFEKGDNGSLAVVSQPGFQGMVRSASPELFNRLVNAINQRNSQAAQPVQPSNAPMPSNLPGILPK